MEGTECKRTKEANTKFTFQLTIWFYYDVTMMLLLGRVFHNTTL